MPSFSEIAVSAPFSGVVVSIAHDRDERVRAGATLVVLEAMKMEHEVVAQAGGVMSSVEVAVGDAVEEGQPLLTLTCDGEQVAGVEPAIEDAEERERVFQANVSAAYERGRGVSMASYVEIDDVIDPADSRRWIATLFDETTPRWWERSEGAGKKRPYVDAW